MKRAILNVAVNGNYVAGQQRLVESLEDFAEKADLLMWQTWPDREHATCNYCFKVDAFLDARKKGYDHALWLDASCWLVKPLDKAWEQIERDGYLLGQEGWTVGEWCSPYVRELLGRKQADLNAMTLVEGKMIGLDLSSDVGNQFLDLWDGYARMGAFNGVWDGPDRHRHDITCAGIIAADMDLELTPHLIEIAHGKGEAHPEVFVQASGL